jgi:hypothetical protein
MAEAFISSGSVNSMAAVTTSIESKTYEDYEHFRRQERQVYGIDDLPDDIAAEILADIDQRRAPLGSGDGGDTIID